MNPSVSITESGRCGHVIYREATGELPFYWEFGGGDVVASVQVGTDGEWRTRHPWAVERRSEILRFVAAELIRQKAPSCRAEIDERSGWINLREGTVAVPTSAHPPSAVRPSAARMPPHPSSPAASPSARYRQLRTRLALGVGLVAVVAGGAVWLKNKVLVIDPGKGAPFGDCVRADSHIATLIQTLEPYTPSLHRDHSKDRQRLSLLLVPLDGTAPRIVPIAADLVPGSYSLAKVLGSDGRTLWLDAVGLHGVDVKTYCRVDASDLRTANPSLQPQWWEDTRGMEVTDRLRITAHDRSQALEIDPATRRATAIAPRPNTTWPFAPQLTEYLAAGFRTSTTTWLGLHSQAEVAGEFRPSRSVRRVEGADDAKVLRRLHSGELDPASDDNHRTILSMTPIGGAEYLNAAFLRANGASEPIRLIDPPGAIMVWTSKPGLQSTLMVGRVDDKGAMVWQLDTGIDRFSLRQILPGVDSTAFVGTRPPIPDKVSEPILVIVQHGSGQARTISLWQ